MQTPQDESKALLQPMVDLFGGADGGAGFANLRHGFLPDMLSQRGTSAQVDEFIKMMYQFSRMCEMMMEKR